MLDDHKCSRPESNDAESASAVTELEANMLTCYTEKAPNACLRVLNRQSRASQLSAKTLRS